MLPQSIYLLNDQIDHLLNDLREVDLCNFDEFALVRREHGDSPNQGVHFLQRGNYDAGFRLEVVQLWLKVLAFFAVHGTRDSGNKHSRPVGVFRALQILKQIGQSEFTVIIIDLEVFEGLVLLELVCEHVDVELFLRSQELPVSFSGHLLL